MAKTPARVSNELPRPRNIVVAASDHALDEFLPEEPAPPVSVREPTLFRYVDARAPAVDLATYEIPSIVPPPVRLAGSHPHAARVAQTLVGALLVLGAVRAYQLYLPEHAADAQATVPSSALGVTASKAEEPVAETPAPPSSATVPADEAAAPLASPPPPPSAPARTPKPAPTRAPAPDRAKRQTITRGVTHDRRAGAPLRGPAQLNPEAAAAFWNSRGGRASVPAVPPPLPSGGAGPALQGTGLATPPAPPPVTSAAKPPVPAASPPVFVAPSTPVRITPAPGAPTTSGGANDPAPPPVASPRELDTAAIETVLTQYRTAFANLDASAVAGFWPSVNSRALNRAFDQIEVQRFEFDRCTTDLKGTTAVTNCSGRAGYTPRIGNKTPRVEPRRWTFTLEKVNGAWLIRRVESARTGS
jgi:hypothetical protein